MKTGILVIVVCVAITVLAVWNNDRSFKASQEVEKVEQKQDSICVVRYENMLQNIQKNAQIIDSLVLEQKSVDSVYLKNQEHLLQQMELLISIKRQILEQIKNQRCSISSTIHIVE